MNTNLQWMNDNVRYFSEWAKLNDSWQEKLQISGNNLIYVENDKKEMIDIGHYYLPNILENPILREQIQIKNKLQAEDIFRIIRVNVLAEENEVTSNTLTITNITMKQDENGQYFLVIEDSQNHKFKITQNIELVLQIYQKLRTNGSYVSFNELKKEMEALNHE